MNYVKMDSNKKVSRRSEYNNLDHLYCHTNPKESGSYVRQKNSPNDMDILKEIKQLKSTINLHLDLIQDQSDQLISKDKLLMILKKENDLLKAKIEKMERRHKSHHKKDESPKTPIVEQLMADLPQINAKQDMLKKVSSTLLNKCTMKLNALEDSLGFQRPSADVEVENRPSNISNTGVNDAFTANITTTINNNNKNSTKHNSTKNGSSIIGSLDGKPISKIVLQRVIVGDVEELAIKPERRISPVKIKYEKISPSHSQSHQNLSRHGVDKSINPLRISKETNKASEVVASAKSESSRKAHRKNGKKEREHKSHKNRSHDNSLRTSHHRREEKSKKKIPVVVEEPQPALPIQPQPPPPPLVTSPPPPAQSTSSCNRNIMTTTELYHTREWQMDEIEMLVNKQISDCGDDAMSVDNVNLEIPRWCELEVSDGECNSDGGEDLSDEVFIKRHARLEHVERKRKKWDVQRIREIRNIERLKRRHCKNEIDASEQTAEGMTSFYPFPENVKFVQVADELPVVAFGEPIDMPPAVEFSLPWGDQYRDPAFPMSQHLATISNIDHTTIAFRTKKRPARRDTSSKLPKAHSKRGSKRGRR